MATISTERLEKYQHRFMWAFIASLAVMLVAVGLHFWPAAPPDGGLGLPRAPKNPPILLVSGSIIISVTSFIGFVLTTIITWRKGHRESTQAKIDRETKTLSLRSFAGRLAIKTPKLKRKRQLRGGGSVKTYFAHQNYWWAATPLEG